MPRFSLLAPIGLGYEVVLKFHNFPFSLFLSIFLSIYSVFFSACLNCLVKGAIESLAIYGSGQ